MQSTRIYGACLRSSVLVAAVVVASGGVFSCGDIPMDCTTGRGVFAVRYIGAEACGLGNGELVGAQTYQGQGSGSVDGIPLPDLTQAGAALQPNRLGVARDAALARASKAQLQGKPYAYAKWDQPRPNADNFCTLASMQASIKNEPVAAAAMDDPATPDEDETVEVLAQDKTYTWSNVRFYDTPGIQGLQFDATLNYSDALFPGGPCTTSVKAVGVLFRADTPNCMKVTRVETVDPADPTGKAKKKYLTAATPNDAFCADTIVSKIHPDFPTVCVAATAPDFLEPVFSCTADTPPVCTPVVPDVKIATQGFCLLTGDQIPVLK